MNVLLDTNILLRLTPAATRALGAPLQSILRSDEHAFFVSAASLWEIAIKTRIGKLATGLKLDHIATFFRSMGLGLIPIDERHAVAAATPEPETRDPFDRMLLAQCAVENMKLLTTDAVLAAHPLAWKS